MNQASRPQGVTGLRPGVLRIAVAIVVVASCPVVFLQDVEAPPWDVVLGSVVPGLVLLMGWWLPIDMFMARLLMTAQDEPGRRRYQVVIKLDACLLAALVVFWGPFFVKLLSR